MDCLKAQVIPVGLETFVKPRPGSCITFLKMVTNLILARLFMQIIYRKMLLEKRKLFQQH